MTTIKGVYENGEIKLLEAAPVTSSQTVLITFIDEDVDADVRKIGLQNTTAEFTDYINDTNEDLYQDYLKK